MSFQSSSCTSFPTLFEQAFPNYTAFISNGIHINNALILGHPLPTDLQLTNVIHDRPTTQVIPQLSLPPSPTYPDVSDPVGAFITKITNSNDELDATHKL